MSRFTTSEISKVVGTRQATAAGPRRVAGAKTFGFPADGLAMQLRRFRTDQAAVARKVAD